MKHAAYARQRNAFEPSDIVSIDGWVVVKESVVMAEFDRSLIGVWITINIPSCIEVDDLFAIHPDKAAISFRYDGLTSYVR